MSTQPATTADERAADLSRSGRVPLDEVAWATRTEVCGSLNVPPPS